MDQNNASPKKMNVGLIGAGFMAKAHSIAYAGMPMFFWPAPIIPVKKMIVDMNEAIAREAKDKFAFESYSTDWHDVVNNPEIDVVDICTPNNVHAEIAIAAAKAGKHIICEKPLALTVDQAVVAVHDTYDLDLAAHAVVQRLGYTADGGVQAGAVAAGSQDTNTNRHCKNLPLLIYSTIYKCTLTAKGCQA